MRVVLQRVSSASVTVDDQELGAIAQGYMLLVAIQDADTEAELDYLVRKITGLRVFEDEAGKMNLSIQDVGGSILSISQFTLYADTRRGNRPSFTDAVHLRMLKRCMTNLIQNWQRRAWRLLLVSLALIWKSAWSMTDQLQLSLIPIINNMNFDVVKQKS